MPATMAATNEGDTAPVSKFEAEVGAASSTEDEEEETRVV